MIEKITIKRGSQSEKDVDDFKEWIMTKAKQLGFEIITISEQPINPNIPFNVDDSLREEELRNGKELCSKCED
jgi:hypothetical protein|tara:strand:+ start:74 stop:292 length:219 start_codon:yes stop_codon:yes gene_type:complete